MVDFYKHLAGNPRTKGDRMENVSTYTAPDAGAASKLTNAGTKEVPVSVDINNLNLAPEEMEIDESADAFAFPPPAPEGTYLFKLTKGRDEWKLGTSKRGQRYFLVHIVATHADGKYADKRIDDRASTMILDSGTSRVAGILAALKKPVSGRTTDVDIVKAMDAALLSEPFIRAATQWQAYCANCEENVTTGEKHFPQKPDGSHEPIVKCRKCGAECGARARIQRYLPA